MKTYREDEVTDKMTVQELRALRFYESHNVAWSDKVAIRCNRCQASFVDGIPRHASECPRIQWYRLHKKYSYTAEDKQNSKDRWEKEKTKKGLRRFFLGARVFSSDAHGICVFVRTLNEIRRLGMETTLEFRNPVDAVLCAAIPELRQDCQDFYCCRGVRFSEKHPELLLNTDDFLVRWLQSRTADKNGLVKLTSAALVLEDQQGRVSCDWRLLKNQSTRIEKKVLNRLRRAAR